MSAILAPVSWCVAGTAQAVPGYAHGCRYPSLMLSFAGGSLTRAARDGLRACCGKSGAPLVDIFQAELGTLDWRQSVEWLLQLWQAVQAAQGVPVFETGRVLSLSQTRVRCVIPTAAGAQPIMAVVVQRTLEYLERTEHGGVSSGDPALEEAILALGPFGVRGSNVTMFVRTAFEAGLPFRELPGGVVQYGVAARARWLDSSFTDATPAISAKLARHKVWAASLLAQAGLPVPPHELVSDADGAVQVAQRLGYPVVVKPADLDGGVGVAAGLETDAEVCQAFESARQHSRQILVEKFVLGRDYRLQVFDGRVIAAVERIPGGVTGDGRSSVEQLVQLCNTDPRRGTGRHAPLKRLVLDDEALQLLQRMGLGAGAVPASGQFVRLRRAANVASGGMPVAVHDRVHPDNARLAERAARALGLDLAGIDLLIPDIAVSWLRSGAAICEVNGQPTLGQLTSGHLYLPIIRKLVPGSGRVPTIVVLGATDARAWLVALSDALAASGLRVGVAGPDGVCVGGDQLRAKAATPHEAGRTLCLNREVDAMVVAVNDDSVLRTGLAFDRFDALILAGVHLRCGQAMSNDARERHLRDLLASLLPSCDGVVVAYAGGGLRAEGFDGLTGAAWRVLEGDPVQVAGRTVEMVRAYAATREDGWGPSCV